MTAEELHFRVAFEGPLAAFTRANPGTSISLWCDWHREVIEVHGAPRASVNELCATLELSSHWSETFQIEEGAHVIMINCSNLPHDNVFAAVDSAQSLLLPPARFEEGWEHYRVVSFREERAKQIFREIKEKGGEVELIAKKPLQVQPLLNTRDAGVNALLDGMTDRQLEAVLLAQKHGYYTSPRRATPAAIADAVGISRSTFDEHLRKAENRLLGNLAPYLALAAKARATVADKPKQ